MLEDHGGSKRKVLKEIPQVAWVPSIKSCNIRNCYGTLYTARIRMRIGKKELVKTSKYSDDYFRTKKQLQIIIGTWCLSCGNFIEDEETKRLRLKRK